MNKPHITRVITIVAVGTITSTIAIKKKKKKKIKYIAVQGPVSRVTFTVSGDNIYIAWIT